MMVRAYPRSLATELDAYTVADIDGCPAIVTLPSPLGASMSPLDGSLVFTGSYILDLVRIARAHRLLTSDAIEQVLAEPIVEPEPPRTISRAEFERLWASAFPAHVEARAPTPAVSTDS